MMLLRYLASCLYPKADEKELEEMPTLRSFKPSDALVSRALVLYMVKHANPG